MEVPAGLVAVYEVIVNTPVVDDATDASDVPRLFEAVAVNE